MAGRVNAAKDDVAERDFRPSGIGSLGERGVGRRADAHWDPVLEREPPVSGEVVGVRMRLDRADDVDVALRGLLEVLLDREGRIDDDRVTGTGIADEVGGAAERSSTNCVKIMAAPTVPPAPAISLEVPAGTCPVRGSPWDGPAWGSPSAEQTRWPGRRRAGGRIGSISSSRRRSNRRHHNTR